MAQTTSELWKTIWKTENTKKEYAFDIDGVWCAADAETDHSADFELYSDFGFGNAARANLSLSLYADNIPRAAQINRYMRLSNGDQVSEWLPKGVFYANRRLSEDGYWTIEAFDPMRKAEVVWEPDQSWVFPMPMPEAVQHIADAMGVEIDSRTVLNDAYTIDYPASNQTMRQTLAWIAAAHGGNFVITDAGKLRLRSLVPVDSSCLATENSEIIIFDDDIEILVSSNATNVLEAAEGTNFDVGQDIVSATNNGKYKPVSRVTLWLDDENCLTAGNDTGFELVADCPYATQEMVDTLFAAFEGYEYQSYEAEEADIDPAFELGDGVTVDGMQSIIAQISDDGYGYPSLSAPGEAALDDGFPSDGPLVQVFNRKIAETYSVISKTAEAIEQKIVGLNGRMASAELTIDGFTVTTTNGDGTKTITLKNGIVTADAIAAGAVTADKIAANSITVDKLVLTDAITWDHLSDSLASDLSITDVNASNAASAVSAWTYPGTTYMNGNMLMTGTVRASILEGGTVNLLASNDYVVGTMSLAYTTTGYGLGITTRYGGIKIESAGNVWITANDGAQFIGLAYSEDGTWSYATFGEHLIPSPGATHDLGYGGYTWRNIYSSTGTITTSDANMKNSIEVLDERYLRLILWLLPKRYKMNNGTSDRYHVGFIAQDVWEGMELFGITDLEFAGFIRDVDAEGNEILMLRYEEFIGLLALALQDHEERLLKLEAVYDTQPNCERTPRD